MQTTLNQCKDSAITPTINSQSPGYTQGQQTHHIKFLEQKSDIGNSVQSTAAADAATMLQDTKDILINGHPLHAENSTVRQVCLVQVSW